MNTSSTDGRIPVEAIPEGGRSIRTLVRHHWPLLVVLAIFVVAACAYSLALPLGEVSDETSHFALVRFIADQGRPPLTNQERHAISIKGDASPFYHGMVALLTQHVDVSDLPELPGALARQERLVPSDGRDYNRVFFHTEDELPPYRGIVLAWHLARLVSIPLGLATIVAIYMTALVIFPGRRYLALTAVILVAFVPRFVTQSAVLNDDNLATPLTAFSIYCLVRVAQGDYLWPSGHDRRRLATLGVLMALAAVAKYHALVLLVEVTLVLAVLAWRQAWPLRLWLNRLLWVIVPFFLVSGWWFAFLVIKFNQIAELGLVQGLLATLGDPVVAQGLDSAVSLEPLGTAGNVEGILSFPAWVWMVFRTFWIVYGFRGVVMAPPGVYLPLAFLAMIGLAGLVGFAANALSRRTAIRTDSPPRKVEGSGPSSAQPSWSGLAVLTLHLVIYMALVFARHIFEPDQTTAQGRHLYPAIVSIAAFSALGLASSFQWLAARFGKGRLQPTRVPALDRTLALGLAVVLLTLTIVTPSAFLLPDLLPYMPLRSANFGDTIIPHQLAANFGPGLDLVGYGDSGGQVKAGEALPITLFWQTSAKPDAAYMAEVCLRETAGQVVTCRRGVPADGLYPMQAWEPGYIIRDRLFLPTPTCLAPGQYQLTLSLLPLQANTPATAVETQGPAALLGVIEVTASGDSASEGYQLWLGSTRLQPAEIALDQLRQTLTLLTYHDGLPAARSSDEMAFLSSETSQNDETNSSAASQLNIWLPVQSQDNAPLVYTCPDGTVVRSDSFAVDPSVKPGRYSLALAGSSGAVPIVTVNTRDRLFDAPASVSNRVDANFSGQLLLMGYDIDLSPRMPGEAIPVTAYWRSLTQQKYGLIEALYLLSSSDMAIQARSEWALGGHYPNLLWAPGEIVIEKRVLQISPNSPPGLHQVELSLYGFMTFEDGSTSAPIYVPVLQGEGQPQIEKLLLGSIRLLDPLNGTPPTTMLAARMGETINLVGFDILTERLQPGASLSVALHWSAFDPPSADYTVFTQLIGPDGQVWAQQDRQPQGGRYPTSAWQAGDTVIDRYVLTLPADAPGGDYRLLAGMYDLVSGARLGTTLDGQPLPDNAIPLAAIHVD